MRTRSTIMQGLVLIMAATFLASCAAMTPKPTQQNFKAPVVTLDHVEVAHYWGWWYFKKSVKPTVGDAGNYGAPMDLAFVFNIQNPNDYPVMMETLKFTVAFEEFDLNTVSAPETQWIPAGKTNQLRVHAMFDVRQSLLSLLVTGGFKLQEKGMGAGAGAAFKQLGAWWKGAPQFAFPINVKEGSAIFKADGLTTITTFGGTFP
ncbi:MAG: hypothetical protein JRI36_10080 [Deltaproteobacteria bacterium]|nr:hypothetical protein [Deltaproteobacteria bacterium]